MECCAEQENEEEKANNAFRNIYVPSVLPFNKENILLKKERNRGKGFEHYFYKYYTLWIY